MRVVLPVLYLKEGSNFKLNTDLELDMSDFNQRDVIFYRVDTLEPLKDKPNRCCLGVGSESFDINLPLEEVDRLITEEMETIFYGAN